MYFYEFWHLTPKIFYTWFCYSKSDILMPFQDVEDGNKLVSLMIIKVMEYF